ncbi:MAG: hypothetical protein JW738_03015 [Actinobacteria bacterium]|nr:hypothetical protein [Actinomycetota bacterium]
MLQLVKGGKQVFGWSEVSTGGVTAIPDEAAEDYKITTGGSLLLIPGSESSGGFGLSSTKLLSGTRLGMLLKGAMAASAYQENETDHLEVSGRKWFFTELEGDLRSIKLSPHAMEEFDVRPGERLLVVKGSGRAIGFVQRGTIFAEALRHPELEVFRPFK